MVCSKRKPIIAVDGFSSCGKSTFARAIAARLGYVFIDTGAMYRAVSLYAIRKGWITDSDINTEELEKHLKEIKIYFKTNDKGRTETYLNGENVEKEIRSLEVANGASRVSTLGFIRQELVRRQQEMGKNKGIVMDGRDIGTVVFPEAELKLFITATPEVRATRRMLELQSKNLTSDYESVLANIKERDERDTTRTESPLKKAADAIEIDNNNLSREEQKEIIKTLFFEKVL